MLCSPLVNFINKKIYMLYLSTWSDYDLKYTTGIFNTPLKFVFFIREYNELIFVIQMSYKKKYQDSKIYNTINEIHLLRLQVFYLFLIIL